MNANRGGHVALMSWPEVAARASGGTAALLPIGAACKEHGLHLPMASDWLQAEWLAARLGEQLPVLVWPTVGYGHYPAFVDYAGSVSVAEDTFRSSVLDILAGIANSGAVGCVVLNTGISTRQSLLAAVNEANLRHTTRFHLHNISDGERYAATRARLEQQRRGGHADEMETSVMLVVAPHLVRAERARVADDVEFAAGPLHPHATPAGNHSPTGVYGDPTLANPAKGRLLLAAMLLDLGDAIDRCLAPESRS